MSLKVDIFANWGSMLIAFIAPLVALPYISHIISQEEFGRVLLYFSISAIFITICEYGFNLTTTRNIVLASCDKSEILNVIAETVVLKLILFFISCISLFVLWFHEYSTDVIYIIFYIFVISFQPNWFFSGIQKSRYNSMYIACGRLLGLFLLLLNVNKLSTPSAILTYFSLGGLVSLMLAWGHVYSECRGGRISINTKSIILKIRKDFHVSVTAILVTLYSSLPVIILAQLSSLTEVANYSSTEKIYKSIEYFITAALSILFPKFMEGLNNNRLVYLATLKKLELLLVALCLPMIAFSFFYGPYIFSVLYGPNYSSDPIRIFIFSMIPLFGALSVLWGNLGLLSISGDKKLLKSVLFGSIINIILVVLISPRMGAVGAGASLLFSTAFIFACMRVSFWRLISKNK